MQTRNFSLLVIVAALLGCTSTPPEGTGKLDVKLYLGEGESQPLVVGFGGSEGGNVYATEKTQAMRDSLKANGFAFLALGYFGVEGTPEELDRIALDAIRDTIISIASHSNIDGQRIAILGGSRGGELVLNLGALYDDFAAIIALAAPNVNLPARYGWNITSSWTHHGEELPYMIASQQAIDVMRDGDFYGGMALMLEDNEGVEVGRIKVEEISCPLLFISARRDSIWPSTFMADQMMQRLESNGHQHHYEHKTIDGGHMETARRIDLIIQFLEEQLSSERITL